MSRLEGVRMCKGDFWHHAVIRFVMIFLSFIPLLLLALMFLWTPTLEDLYYVIKGLIIIGIENFSVIGIVLVLLGLIMYSSALFCVSVMHRRCHGVYKISLIASMLSLIFWLACAFLFLRI